MKNTSAVDETTDLATKEYVDNLSNKMYKDAITEVGTMVSDQTQAADQSLNNYLAAIQADYITTTDADAHIAAVQAAVQSDLSVIIDAFYPVGSVYITFSNTFDPNTAWPNTTWTKIKEGIFLEATETTAGTEKEAGLPNITGNAYNIQGVGYNADGAFTKTALGNASWSGNIAGYHQLHFDASRSSAVYGKSSTVQPHSLTVVMWQRTA